jgi:xylulose-5-phosphate/fructose-6-phosphate phosphoketolase
LKAHWRNSTHNIHETARACTISFQHLVPQPAYQGQSCNFLLASSANYYCSHINAETPGAIHEGGELGYALAVAFGAAMDNPDLIVPCIVGDGEAETGPTATFVDNSLYQYLANN